MLPPMNGDALAARVAVRWRDLLGLTKSGITAMVALSAGAGMLLATSDVAPPPSLWVHTLLGTALVAAAASALNQVVEVPDSLMRRTPSGRCRREACARPRCCSRPLGCRVCWRGAGS